MFGRGWKGEEPWVRRPLFYGMMGERLVTGHVYSPTVQSSRVTQEEVRRQNTVSVQGRCLRSCITRQQVRKQKVDSSSSRVIIEMECPCIRDCFDARTLHASYSASSDIHTQTSKHDIPLLKRPEHGIITSDERRVEVRRLPRWRPRPQWILIPWCGSRFSLTDARWEPHEVHINIQ